MMWLNKTTWIFINGITKNTEKVETLEYCVVHTQTIGSFGTFFDLTRGFC